MGEYALGGTEMVCDNCGNDIEDTVIATKSGEKWCYACMKKAKYPASPKRTATKDSFVLLARKLRAMHSIGTREFDRVIMKCGEKRAYTNGHVLISEMKKTPAEYELIDMDHLGELPKDRRFRYPPIEKVIKVVKENDAVIIPEDFYQYAKAFPGGKQIRIQVRRDGITVKDSWDEMMTLNYREFSAPLINEADFQLRYFMVLKPREIIIAAENGSAHVKSSYVEGLEKCVAVLLMPMTREEKD